MKYYLALLIPIILTGACKKSEKITTETLNAETDSLELNGFKFDYASIVIDGKTFVCKDDGGVYGWGSGPASRKVESIDEGGMHLDKGHPDSVMYSRHYTISNDSTLYIKVTFCKKYAKKDGKQELIGWFPKTQLDLFRPGLQGFATDWEREYSYDGVALYMRLKEAGTYKTYTTYSQQYPNLPTTITNNSQKDSRFEIVKLAHIKSGEYIEAKFRTKIFNSKEESRTIDNGFMRLHVGFFKAQ